MARDVEGGGLLRTSTYSLAAACAASKEMIEAVEKRQRAGRGVGAVSSTLSGLPPLTATNVLHPSHNRHQENRFTSAS